MQTEIQVLKLDTAAHTCNPSNLQGRGRRCNFETSLSNLAKSCLEIKNRKGWGCSSVFGAPVFNH